MLVDITEKERGFLERICSRAETFAMMNLPHKNSLSNDVTEIIILKNKFRELNSKLMEQYND